MLVWALACAWAIATPSAEAGDPALARKSFQQGVQLFQRGDFQGARAMFLQADTQNHAPAIIYNLGRVEEQLGKMQAAVDAYEAYIAEVGEAGEFAQASAIAIAQIKKRSVRLRIQTTPPGARVFLNGATLKETAPTNVLVPAGSHHVSVEWKLGAGTHQEERDIDAKELGATVDLNFAAPEVAVVQRVSPLPPKPRVPEDLIVGGAFEVVPYYFFRNASQPTPNRIEIPAAGITAGVQGHIGYAINPQFEVMFRGFIWVGSEGVPPTYGFGGGPAISIHAAKSIWIGIGLIGGKAYACRGRCVSPNDDQIERDAAGKVTGKQWRTDLVFGPQLELTYVVYPRNYGDWFVSIAPGMYFANAPPFGDGDNYAIFAPLGFGLRSY